MKHAEHFDPLQRLEVKQHVLTQDHRKSLTDLAQRQKIVLLERHPLTDLLNHPQVLGFVARLEVFSQDALGQSR